MIALALLLASPVVAASTDLVSEFGKTCAVSKSKTALITALTKDGWKVFGTLAQSHLEREIAVVSPMLEAQGLASDYIICGRDAGGRHFELALSETKKPIAGGDKLIGCSIYDFAAIAPVDAVSMNAFAPAIIGQKKTVRDVQVEK